MRTLLLFLLIGLVMPVSAQVDPALFQDLDFRSLGPTRGGRATTVAGHAAHPDRFYFGATGGGVWRTDDAGASWQNVSDGFFETASIGAIRVAPSNPEVIWVGTGSDGIRSNVIVGRGVYRSEDGAKTWAHAGLRDAGQIGAVEVHPADASVAYVAALGSPFGPNPTRGVFKTTDGGASWSHVLFVSDSTGAIDLELNPADPNEVYAAFWRGERKPWTIISGAERENGIYKSVDGGATWRKLETGLPAGLTGKIDLSVTPADPNRLYALVEAPDPAEGLYRSDDRGETWTLVNSQGMLMSRPFYYTNVTADPADADRVYVNNLGFYRSDDGGASFRRLNTPHGDNHDLWINPEETAVMVQSNDGGANVSLDGGRTWSTQHNQNTAELYQIDVDDRFPYWIYAGQQDNSTIAVPVHPPAASAPAGPEAWWDAIGGCETGPVVPKPGDPDIVYANCKGRFGRYNRRTGQEQQYYVGAMNMYGRNPAELPYRFQRVVPIEVSPHDPNTVYHGSQYVHVTQDGGRNWTRLSPDLTAFAPSRQVPSGGPITRDITGEEHYSTLYVIQESPLEPGVIWTGANDGPVHVTRDGGETWHDVTPPMPPEGRIQHIDPSPHAPGTAYVAAYRYLLNDFAPYAWKTEDYGQTWTRLTDGENGIPADTPVRVVREDPAQPGLLYAGTEFGLYISFDDGVRWQSFQLDLPVTPITDLKRHQNDLVLSTMGRGFWILDDVTPLHHLAHAATSVLLPPNAAYRLRHWVSSAEGGPEYRAPGALIDYVLPGPAQDVTLEILRDGAVIRRYRGQGESVSEEARQEMRAPYTLRRGGQGLGTQPGHHRFQWDLRHAPGEDLEARGRGPMAVPGAYTIRLVVDGTPYTQPLTLMADPRVLNDGVTVDDMAEQLAFNQRLLSTMAEADRLVEHVTALRSQLKSEAGTEAEALRARLEAVHAALVTPSGMSYPPPMLVDQLRYLYGMTSRADQAPGSEAHTRLASLRHELDALKEIGVQVSEHAEALDGKGR